MEHNDQHHVEITGDGNAVGGKSIQVIFKSMLKVVYGSGHKELKRLRVSTGVAEALSVLCPDLYLAADRDPYVTDLNPVHCFSLSMTFISRWMAWDRHDWNFSVSPLCN